MLWIFLIQLEKLIFSEFKFNDLQNKNKNVIKLSFAFPPNARGISNVGREDQKRREMIPS